MQHFGQILKSISNSAHNLIEALTHFQKAFAIVAGNRALYQFFSGKDYIQSSFNEEVVSVEAGFVRLFFSRFLEEDFLVQADRDIAANSFGNLAEILKFKEYIPEEALYKLQQRLFAKVEFAIAILNKKFITEYEIPYLRYTDFYNLLNRFSSVETDQKVMGLLNLLTRLKNSGVKKQFISEVFVAMSAYIPFDGEFSSVLERNRSGIKKKTNINWIRIPVILILLVRIFFWFHKYESKYGSSPTYTPTANEKFSDSISSVQQQIDANRVKLRNDRQLSPDNVGYFYNYLTNYDKSELKTDNQGDHTFADSENPFSYFYGTDEGNSKEILLKNNSKYDLIVMKNQESGGVSFPVYAYFVKSKKSIKIASKSNAGQLSYNFYFGNDLTLFGSRTIKWYGAPRFVKLPENAREKLGKTFIIANEMTITDKGTSILLRSNGMKCKPGPATIAEYLLE
ncbi:hypothetical protein [Flavobacterium sp. 3HN19-14]|uniref:hypothetical protein n=1 Tax=Flavobacterium sp. 3HN19-14 TaxID=3448133 RepID=UPI003EDE8A81